jgi:hypothetical protein
MQEKCWWSEEPEDEGAVSALLAGDAADEGEDVRVRADVAVLAFSTSQKPSVVVHGPLVPLPLPRRCKVDRCP